jgi:hypothetical protein
MNAISYVFGEILYILAVHENDGIVESGNQVRALDEFFLAKFCNDILRCSRFGVNENVRLNHDTSLFKGLKVSF